MTLKYESEILFDLMKRDGDDTPSDVLPYESELKEKYLKQVEGAYPKLMDYRPEWLNYNLEAHLPADFPVETLSNVTSASVDNVVPYAYRSAILKGNTLVNIKTKYNQSPTPGSWVVAAYDISNLKTNTKYLFKVFNESNIDVTLYVSAQNATGLEFEAKANSIGIGTITTKSEIVNDVMLRLKSSSEDVIGFDCNILLLEYQDGMENWDIPYFEGMQSVKMPVLTTTGKNLFDESKILKRTWNAPFANGNPIISPVNGDNLCSSGRIKVKKGESYVISGNNIIREVVTYYKTDDISEYPFDGMQAKNSRFTSLHDGYIEWYLTNDNVNNPVSNVQIEKGTVSTSYEPYKTNILTCNEEVELRGIGGVTDELDLLTGEYVQRIGEVVFDGSDDEVWQKYNSNDNAFIAFSNVPLPNTFGIKYTNTQMIVDDFKVVAAMGESADGCYISNTSKFNLSVSTTKATTVSELKNYLQSNPITVQYQLATESVKTVDLNIQDQDGNTLRKIKPIEGTMNIHSDGTPVKPTITMEIPVEAITQNLASFIKGE